jgi:predicted MFS family arabinose efflux permease
MTYNVPQQSIQQAVISNELLGRATAAVALAVNAGLVAGALAGGLLAQLLGIRSTLVVATGIAALCVLPTALGPLRRLREVPAAGASP